MLNKRLFRLKYILFYYQYFKEIINFAAPNKNQYVLFGLYYLIGKQRYCTIVCDQFAQKYE